MTAPVDQIIPDALELARREGSVPSKDRLMRTFRIGRPKATEIHQYLRTEAAKARSRRGQVLASRSRTKTFRREVKATVYDPAIVPTSPGMGPVNPWTRYGVPVQPEGQPTPMEGPRPPAQSEALPSQVKRPMAIWPVLVVALGAFIAIWAGWVALGKLTGFGKVNLLPGFWSGWTVDTAITLPLGMEAYAAYAFYVWLHPGAPERARSFAAWSSLAAILLGMGGQTAYHLMTAAGITAAPWQITTAVSCLPVAVFGMAAALVHLVRSDIAKEV
ncbi:ABC transporter permease [Winogradskya consettensis]|uniref:ABC transporter permease n=1 Tax=Winogradskya consettensis TaxID=113560 RepID=A0A919W6A0_9ACTN|nr:ABC transporter permease [Actinoplanes consettensis]GIM82742.1 ABC transporter permease [Actinoplanes consettensis]